MSGIIFVLWVAIAILFAYRSCGMFGVALGALGKLGTMIMALTVDANGPRSVMLEVLLR